jgi:peptidoglycan hydrolase-like protein with peptidoglycan-binding domain
LSSLTHARTRIVAIGAAIVVLLVAGAWLALSHGSAKPSASGKPGGAQPAATGTVAAAGPLQVTSVTPASHATGVSGAREIVVKFSAPVASGSPMPVVTPHIAGTWHGRGTSKLRFVPARGFREDTSVTVKVPGGPGGVQAASGGTLSSTVTLKYRTGSYSVARLDQLLAQLGYLPLTWAPAQGAVNPAPSDAAAQVRAAYRAPAGQFSWKAGYPTELRKFWHGGSTSGLILSGAVMAFESNNGLGIDGIAGPEVWSHLLTDEAAQQMNPHGYTYAIASESSPETLTIWHNGVQVLQTVANTGIQQAPTTIGTAPVYLKYYTQIMRGKNPDGTKYADRVYYVSYFRGGEAVHYYLRGSYGFPQSLGCVELPWNEAKTAWPYLTYGSLVTVNRGALTPAGSPTDPTT